MWFPGSTFPKMNQVVRPHMPYRGPIPGGLHEGKIIEIKGHVPYGVDRFSINLLTGLDANSDTAFHISVRFDGRVVVRNTKQQGCWGPEERHGLFPFASGQDFTVMILVEPAAYRVAVNSQHCWEFHHRLPLTRVCSVFIDGNIRIERIEFVDKVSPFSRPGICNPSFPIYPGGPSGGIFPGITPSIGIQPTICPPSVGIPATICPPPENIAVYPAGIAQPSSNLSPVYNPPIPYAYPIYGGLRPGMMIYISGRPSASAYKLTVNLQSGTAPYPPPDIAFHFDARFFNFTVVRNTRSNNVWANEEVITHQFPFQPAVNFDMIIRIQSDKFMVALNGQHYCEMRHRLTPLSRFDTLYIENDVIVSSIRFA